jgi:hypothetical protein
MGQVRLAENKIHSHLRVKKRRVENWHMDVRWLDDQRKFGTRENDPLRTSLPT